MKTYVESIVIIFLGVLCLSFGVTALLGFYIQYHARFNEVPYQVGVGHCIFKMSNKEIKEAMAWKQWKVQPELAIWDPKHDPEIGESYKNDDNGNQMPGRLYCGRGDQILHWDLSDPGTEDKSHKDATWTAHCYYVSVRK